MNVESRTGVRGSARVQGTNTNSLQVEPRFSAPTADPIIIRPVDPSVASAQPTRGSEGEHESVRPLRVALYMKGFPPNETGGPIEVAHNLLRELLRTRAAHVTLIVQTDSTERDIRAALGDPEGLDVVRLGYFPSVRDFRAFRRVLAAFRAADLIHFNEFPFRQLSYVILAKARGVPVVFSLHGLLSEEASTFLGPSYPLRIVSGEGEAKVRAPRTLISFLVRVYRWIAPRWTAVVANSNAHAGRAARLEGFDRSRIAIIPNGVEPPSHPPVRAGDPGGPPRLLFVGKLEDVKGPDLLVSALEILGRQGYRVDVAFAGGGSLEKPLRAAAERLENHRVVFHGSLPHEAVEPLYAWSDIVVVPSRYESFGVVVLEAMAAGRPLVATAVGGIPENVSSPRNAILVEPNADAIAAGIRHLIDRSDLREAMAVANIADASERRWATIVPRYVALYRKLTRAGSDR